MNNLQHIGLPLDNKQTSFEKFLKVLDGQMTRPEMYGWFHLLCLALVIGLCIFVVRNRRNVSDKQVTTVIGATALALFLLEVYKQLNFSYDWESDTWSYQWYAFPFQFCSTPMYVMMVAFFVKNQKFRDALYAFLGTYGLFAGTAVMLYPSTVFTETVGVNIQTMVHHGAMVVIGFFLYVSGKIKLEHKTILKALPVFAVLSAMALTMNILYIFFGDPEQTFNMFFISPIEEPSLPLLDILLADAPYPLYLLTYLVGFTGTGYVMLLLAMLSVKIYQKYSMKQISKQEGGTL